MWRIISFALLSTVAVSSYHHTSSYRDIIKIMVNVFLPYELSPSNKEWFEYMCLHNKGFTFSNKTFSNVTFNHERFNNFMSEWSNVVQDVPTSTLREAAKYLEDGETLKSLDIYCRLSAKIKTSSAKIISALTICVEPEYREEYGNTMNVFDSFLDYICFNSSEKVNTFLQNGGEECIKDRESELKQCSFIHQEDTLLKELNKKKSEFFMIHAREEFIAAMYATQCREEKIFQTCVKKELDQCPSPSTSSFIFGLMDRMPKIWCKDPHSKLV